MKEIQTFLKSLLSRKFLLAVGAFVTAHQASIPPKYQAAVSAIVAGAYFLANILEKKVVGDASAPAPQQEPVLEPAPTPDENAAPAGA